MAHESPPVEAAALSERSDAAHPGGEWFADLTAGTRLTRKGAEIAHFLAVNPRLASFGSASEIAEHVDVNVATVVRFAQALGFSGWPEFRLHFRHRYLGTLLPSGVANVRPATTARPALAAVERDAENLSAALTSVDFAAVERVAALIAAARRTLVLSAGSHTAVAHVFSHLASFMGYPVTHESHGGPSIVANLSALKPGDCVLAVSFWRPSKQIVLATEQARLAGMATVALTDSLFSPLARIAEERIIVPTESDSFFQSMAAPLSVVYGLIRCMFEIGGDRVQQTISSAEELYAELDVLYT